MTERIDLDRITIEEWRQLGFYYDLVEKGSTKEWQFSGSKKGLSNFAEILTSYTDNGKNDSLSEHEHVGPYNYLKIMTWYKPVITDQYFAGTIQDLKALANLICEKLKSTQEGEAFSIDADYGVDNTAATNFLVKADTFDPASMDDQIQK